MHSDSVKAHSYTDTLLSKAAPEVVNMCLYVSLNIRLLCIW